MDAKQLDDNMGMWRVKEKLWKGELSILIIGVEPDVVTLDDVAMVSTVMNDRRRPKLYFIRESSSMSVGCTK